MDGLYKAIAALGEKFNAEKIVLFGSRARGDNHERSDIDLAVHHLELNRYGSHHIPLWIPPGGLPLFYSYQPLSESRSYNTTPSFSILFKSPASVSAVMYTMSNFKRVGRSSISHQNPD